MFHDYNGRCRDGIVVYKMEHAITGHVHMGSTSQHVKDRWRNHTSAILKCHRDGKKSASVARFVAATLINFQPGVLNTKIVRSHLKYSILWQGNPLSVVQTFGTPTCKLCSRERLEIYKRARFKRNTLINERTDLFEACKHKAAFHRYEQEAPCTDETQGSRKGPARSNHRVLISV